jgi:hypothetical protein
MDGSPQFLALNREASLALEATRSGLEAISTAHSSRPGAYLKAFFDLSTAIERIGKLAVVIDHALQNDGAFPNDETLRRVGHDVVELNGAMQAIRERYPADNDLKTYPEDEIVPIMLTCLSDFAKGARYYNLDFLVGGRGAGRALGDPVAVWRERVAAPILAKHYPKARRSKDEAMAEALGERLEPYSFVRGWDESGALVSDMTTRLTNAQAAKYLQRWTPFYLCRLFRYYTMLLKDLSYASLDRRVPFVPWMGDHFGRFVNDDSFFKQNKVWRY